MAATFDGASKRIILDSTSVTASELWSAYVDWLDSDSDNHKWGAALSQTGGDDLGGGLFIPVYIFLLNGWRVRPMESSHTLTLTGNLFVQGGGDNPVVSTLGNYRVLTVLTVPVQAQAYAAEGGGSSGTADWSTEEKQQIRSALGINGEKTAGVGGLLQAIKSKIDRMGVSMRIRFIDPGTHTMSLVRGNSRTIIFDDLDDDWTGATNIKLGIRRAGQRSADPITELTGVVVNSSSISVTLPTGFGITAPELEPGEGIYEWDLSGKLASGAVVTPVSISPLIIKDRIARVS